MIIVIEMNQVQIRIDEFTSMEKEIIIYKELHQILLCFQEIKYLIMYLMMMKKNNDEEEEDDEDEDDSNF